MQIAKMKIKEDSSGLRCKLCGSTRLVKFGRYHGIQRWWCKDCHRKFADNNAIPEMKTPAEQVAAAIDMYFSGIQLKHIPGMLFSKYGLFVSNTSVYNWITHFGRLAYAWAGNIPIKAGGTWLISESPAHNDIKDITLTFLDLVDVSSGFLIATGLTQNISQYDVKGLIEKGEDRVGMIPSSILTDGWKGYTHGISLALGLRAKNVHIFPFNSRGIEKTVLYWQSASWNRSRIISGLKKEKTTLCILNGWHVHYNYFTPPEALSGRTPAEAAGADCGFRSWLDVIRQSRR
ncbi:MAG: IS1 family transposase [Dehalococcoidales bacterium]|nr:IS1 family transposase [Dehalococcoidales bacterium]